MSDFSTIVSAGAAAQQPDRHVNYVQGMVLGVDDFTQEFAYLAGRDSWLARDLIGYGVVSGLDVSTDEDARKGPRVKVAAGAALTARGELVCVPEAQCAFINDWLRENAAAVRGRSRIDLHVLLCYDDCATDRVPLPGEPCRSEDELTAPSRLRDDFRLELSLEAPDQREEEALRAFVAWLRGFAASEEPGTISLEEFTTQVRAWRWSARPVIERPILRPIERPGSSRPEPGDRIERPDLRPAAVPRIPAGQLDLYLRVAMRIWAGELRPLYRAPGGGCATPPDNGCILLASFDIDLTSADPPQATARPEPDDERAPFLLHVRMLQEWLIAGLRDVAPGDSVVAEQQYAMPFNDGSSPRYARADHTHGTPPPPTLQGDVTSTVTEANEPAGLLDTTVVRLQQVPVEPLGRPPGPGAPPHVLTLMNTSRGWHWEAAPAAAPADEVKEQIQYSLPSSPGDTSTIRYARADHTHGTPPPPSLEGDVASRVLDSNAGRLGVTVNHISRLLGHDVVPATTTAAEGNILRLMRAGRSLVWQPVAPPTGSGTPALPTIIGEVETTSSDTTSGLITTRVAQIYALPVRAPDASLPGKPGDLLTLVDTGDGNLEWQPRAPAGVGGPIAAGQFKLDGSAVGERGGLAAFPLDTSPTKPFGQIYLLFFPAYSVDKRYLVTGTPWVALADGPAVFEYLGRSEEVDSQIKERLQPIIDQNQPLLEGRSIDTVGLLVRCRQVNNSPVSFGFLAQITEY